MLMCAYRHAHTQKCRAGVNSCGCHVDQDAITLQFTYTHTCIMASRDFSHACTCTCAWPLVRRRIFTRIRMYSESDFYSYSYSDTYFHSDSYSYVHSYYVFGIVFVFVFAFVFVFLYSDYERLLSVHSNPRRADSPAAATPPLLLLQLPPVCVSVWVHRHACLHFAKN